MDVFAKRALPPLSTRRSFLGSGTQEKCVGCKETQAKLESCQNFSVQLKNKLLEGKKDLELARVKELTQERDDLLRKAVKREKEIVALKAENSAIKSVNGEMMEMFDRRMVPQSLDQRDFKKRRLAPNSSPLLQDLQARPEAFPVTNADLIEPLKGSDDTVARKSLLARFQQARRNSAKRAEAAAEAEKEQAAVPLHVHRQVESESEDESNQDPDEALLLWHQSWANFFDEETRATTPRAPKRKGGLRRTASEYLRTPKRAKSERTPSRDHSSSESEGSSAPQTPSRPSRSAKTKVLSLREPTLGGKLRPGYPGTFDLDGAVPHWRERESVPKTPRKTPTRSYAELTQSKTPHKTPTRREAKVKTPCAEAEAINKTPQKTPRKRNASDVEVCDNDGFRYFTSKTHAATPAPFKTKRLTSRQPSFWDKDA
ncbi:uncharacterized protein ACA1_058080 [Acanthamoeba castellanii str. Neff]|uniref:Uncharacterized protein n=1 Tax=Acanthamoeba castellanii (strain ATCC 30010 / Neff) TaxID=1257118 RepID=L8GW61_ACACF|nr:uncharacterized protein ACA1_058080 [Acanthamoeba castellanii str. Neff]ELR17152.1 hypothetical protein ACA1_058080 [Acanthamoeba castellanii str. Neff]